MDTHRFGPVRFAVDPNPAGWTLRWRRYHVHGITIQSQGKRTEYVPDKIELAGSLRPEPDRVQHLSVSGLLHPTNPRNADRFGRRNCSLLHRWVRFQTTS